MTGTLDVKLTVLGEREAGRAFTAASSYLRPALVLELDKLGRDIVQAAQDRVPYGGTRRSGPHTRDKIRYAHGLDAKSGRGFIAPEAGGPLRLTVLGGEPIGHLIERGVNATVSSRRNRAEDVYASDVRYRRRKGVGMVAEGTTARARKLTLAASGIRFVRPYRLVMPARPFFVPAVESVDVAARLQAATSRAAAGAIDVWWNA